MSPPDPSPETAAPASPRPGFEHVLLLALLVSTIGDEITQVALVFTLAPAGSGVGIAALLIALLLPGALAGPYAGKLVDERDAARVLVWTSLLQGLISLAIAIRPGETTAIAGAACLSLLFAFSGAATFALIPLVGRAARLSVARTNGLMEFAGGGGAAVGPVVGGALVAAGGVSVALLADAATFLVLAAVLAASRLSRASTPPAGREGWSPGAVLRSYAPVLKHGRIMVLLAAFWAVVAALAVSDAVYVFLVTEVLGLGALAYGTLIAFWAGAYLAGAWLAGGLAARRPERTAFAGAAVMALSFLSIGLMPVLVGGGSIAFVAAAFTVGGFGNAACNVAVRTLLQTRLPPALHGRAAGLYGSGTRFSEAGGFMLGGAIGPARVLLAYLLSGAVALTAAGLGSASALAARTRTPPP